jgi:sugar O-acyltransferase (sialic acid O-acetyltransferase NeuD family)
LKDIIIVGASGFGRELAEHVLDVAAGQADIRLKGFLDDDPDKQKDMREVPGLRVIGDTVGYAIQDNDRFLIGPGNPDLRKLLSERLAARGGRFFVLSHPRAYVAASASLGAGCIIGPFANVGSNARLGEHVMLNLYATAGHDTQIGSCSVISPYGIANGGSVIGERVLFGTHAVVTPNRKVGDQSHIAAGAVVYRDVPKLTLATGNPAKCFPLGPQTGMAAGDSALGWAGA